MLQVILFFTKHCIYAYNLQFNANVINNHNYHLLNKKPFLQGAHLSLPGSSSLSPKTISLTSQTEDDRGDTKFCSDGLYRLVIKYFNITPLTYNKNKRNLLVNIRNSLRIFKKFSLTFVNHCSLSIILNYKSHNLKKICLKNKISLLLNDD